MARVVKRRSPLAAAGRVAAAVVCFAGAAPLLQSGRGLVYFCAELLAAAGLAVLVAPAFRGRL